MWKVIIDKETTMDKKMPWIVCPDKGCPLCAAGLSRKKITPILDLESGKIIMMERPEKLVDRMEAGNETTAQGNTSPAK